MVLQLAGEQEETVVVVGVREGEVGAFEAVDEAVDAIDGVGQVVAEVVLKVVPQLQRIPHGAEVQDEGEDGGLLEGGGPGPGRHRRRRSLDTRRPRRSGGPQSWSGPAGRSGEGAGRSAPPGRVALQHAADRRSFLAGLPLRFHFLSFFS